MKPKQRGTQDEIEILREIINGNVNLKEKVLKKIRQSRLMGVQSLNDYMRTRSISDIEETMKKKKLY